MKTVLMVAYHFPPIRHSSGVQRTLQFAIHLRAHGWRPVVLTVHPRAYELTGDDLLGAVPDDVIVHRAFALDATRHLAVAGRYPALVARPDRYGTWAWAAVPAGLRLIRRYRPRLLWSTYPVATAMVIGQRLARASGLPWVADLRDPMTDDDYPTDPRQRRWFETLERQVVERADRVVLTAPGAVEQYAAGYPAVPATRWACIPNGYDEAAFAAAGAGAGTGGPPADRPLRLVHSGIVYPSERDPTALFDALARLKADGRLDAGDLRITLRATGYDALYGPMLAERDIDDMVELAPPVGYREALGEMLRADGLLLLQAANCNRQIPAKLYEYLRAGRPVVALTDPAGDTAGALGEFGLGVDAPLDDPVAIAAALERFVDEARAGQRPLADRTAVRAYSREGLTGRLAALFDEVVRGSRCACPAKREDRGARI